MPTLMYHAMRIVDGRRELPNLLKDMVPPSQEMHKRGIWAAQATRPPTNGLLYNLQVIDYMQKPQGCFHDAATGKITSLRRNVLQKAHCPDTERIICKMLLYCPRAHVLPEFSVSGARAPICADSADKNILKADDRPAP